MMNLDGVTLEDVFNDEALGTTMAYFIAPKEILKVIYPDRKIKDAVHAEISIEFPIGRPEAKYCSVALSPTKNEDGTYVDYDWTDVSLTEKEVNSLLEMIKQ